MKKTAFVTFAALVAFAGAAEAGSRNNPAAMRNNPSALVNTGTVTANIDVTRTRSLTITRVNKIDTANYSGVGTISNSEHNGVVEIKNSGSVRGYGETRNDAVSNVKATEIAVGASGQIGPIGGNVTARGSLHQADSRTTSGSVAKLDTAGGTGNGRVAAGGYASTSNFSGQQWGTTVTHTQQLDVTRSNTVKGAGSISVAR